MALEVSTDDLALMLGTPVDEDPASLMIERAADLCRDIVSPLPDSAKGVILSAAARAYANPQGVTQETVGIYNVSRPWAGVYLTRAERAALKRAAGAGGAFSVDMMPSNARVPRDNPWSFARAEEAARNRGDL